jgi:hypothetical protein
VGRLNIPTFLSSQSSSAICLQRTIIFAYVTSGEDGTLWTMLAIFGGRCCSKYTSDTPHMTIPSPNDIMASIHRMACCLVQELSDLI